MELAHFRYRVCECYDTTLDIASGSLQPLPAPAVAQALTQLLSVSLVLPFLEIYMNRTIQCRMSCVEVLLFSHWL